MKNRALGVLVWLVAGMSNGLVGQEIVEFAIPTPNVRVAGLAIGPDGNVWFTEDTVDTCVRGLCFTSAVGIARIGPTGIIGEFPVNGTFALGGLTAGPDGNLWFSEGSGISFPGLAGSYQQTVIRA